MDDGRFPRISVNLGRVLTLGILLASCTTLSVPETPAPIPAFPGAEGFGAEAIGGRGGQVLLVTNLNDSGPGPDWRAWEPSASRSVR